MKNKYITFIGDEVTYGKFVATPFSDLVGEALEIESVNLGCSNIGLDAVLYDESLLSICKRSEITVLQIMGAANLSNRFYTVHPRRNDRFIQASPMMEQMFVGIDFMEFNFTRHMLARLKRHSSDGYVQLVRDLQETWVVKMRQVIQRLDGQVVLLWCGQRPTDRQGIENEPIFVTKAMIDAIRPKALGYVEMRYSPATKKLGTEGMRYLEHEASAAKHLPGPVAHEDIAWSLVPVLKNIM